MLRSACALFLVCLALIAVADVFIEDTVVTGTAHYYAGFNSENLYIRNSSIIATDGGDDGIELEGFGTAEVIDSSLTSAQRIVYYSINNVSHSSALLSSGVGCNTDDDDEANIDFENMRHFNSQDSVYTSGQSIRLASALPGDFRLVRDFTSVNDRFTSVYCYYPSGATQQMQAGDTTDKPVVYIKLRTNENLVTKGTITNPLFDGDWFGLFFANHNIDGEGNNNFAADFAAIWFSDSDVVSTNMVYRRLRLIRTNLVDVVATSNRQLWNNNYYQDADVRVFGRGTSSFTNVQLLGLRRGIVVQNSFRSSFSNGVLVHNAGLDVFQFADNFGTEILNEVRVSGPTLQYGDPNGQFRLTSRSTRFQCEADPRPFDINRDPLQNEVAVINTPSADNCVEVDYVGAFSVQFRCRTNNLYFQPNGPCWTVLESSTLDNRGPHICRHTSSMELSSDRTVLNGVSFISAHTYLLTQTFREITSGNPYDVQSTVSANDFYVRNGRVVSVNEVSGSSSTADGVVTHVYQVEVEGACDGSVELRYGGTIGRLFSNAQVPNFLDAEVCNRGGSYKDSHAIVFAGCLANQFCI